MHVHPGKAELPGAMPAMRVPREGWLSVGVATHKRAAEWHQAFAS